MSENYQSPLGGPADPGSVDPRSVGTGSTGSESVDSRSVDTGERAPRRRRRGWIIAIAVILVLVVLVVVADVLARNYAKEEVRGRVASALGISRDQVDVDIPGFSMLVQLASGTVDRVNVGLDSVSFGELSGSAEVTLRDVPIDTAQPTRSMDIAVSLPADQLQELSSRVSDRPIDSVEIEGKNLLIGAEFSLFSLTVPVTVSAVPSAEDGSLAFTPESVVFNGVTYTAAELSDQFGTLAEDALKTQTLCVAQYLPSILTLSDARIADDELALTFHGDDTILSAKTFRQKGSC